ncbi:hypothetical protein [Pseudomonas panipatensis]|uniref:hypothetical protein n=1 Tax=Pseudomonas panipatensis TaxID=428992 RepID=UPI00111404E4
MFSANAIDFSSRMQLAVQVNAITHLFRWLFNEVLRRCMAAGLVKGEGFAVDRNATQAKHRY